MVRYSDPPSSKTAEKDPAQWRLDAFQVYRRDVGFEDPIPDQRLAALSRQFFDNPFQAYVAIRDETDQWKEFVAAAEPVLRAQDSFEEGETLIDCDNALAELEHHTQMARDQVIRRLKQGMERAANNHQDLNGPER